ncbi:MAG: hypothetical protein ACOCRX_01440 [Candidatus Woesearchaeota archaeon]
MKKPKGIILYKGKSLIDNQIIVAIATGFRDNANYKTGDMIQTWILKADVPPVLAKRLGFDYSICGDCKQRQFGSCYVNLLHGPCNIYKAYQNGSYEYFDNSKLKYFKNKDIRIGSYGDPSAIPFNIWDKICSVTNNYTGYTHNWKNCNPDLKKYCMASVELQKEYKQAKAMGWRTFRIKTIDDNKMDNEIVCPASIKDNINCSKCNLCSGKTNKTNKDIAITVHGANFKIQRFIKGMKKIKNKKKYKIDYTKRYEKLRQACKI